MQQSEYSNLMHQRQEVLRINKSRRVRGLPTEPVPPKPERPRFPVAYTLAGDYEGVLRNADECPTGCIVKMEYLN